MTAEEKFIEKITELKDTAMIQGGMLTQDQIDEAFPDISDVQKKVLTDYFKDNNIGIGSPLKDEEFLSEKDSRTIKMYMEDLEEIEEIDESMKRVLIMNALNGDKSAREKLINSYLRTVVDTARLYSNQGVETGDLIGEGNVALITAISMLESIEDPSDCDEMVMRTVMNTMDELVNAENSEYESDRKVMAMIMKVLGKAKELYETFGQKCSVQELADAGDFSFNDIYSAISLAPDCKKYIDVPENSGDE